MAYPGYKKWGGGASVPIYEKWGGGGGALQVRYTKRGGGGGGRFRSHIRKVGGGGGAIPLQIRRKYVHVPTYVLPRYTSYARANESMRASVKYMPAKVNLL